MVKWRGKNALFVIFGRSFECLPLLTVMAKNNQLCLFTGGHIQKFACTGACLLFVVVHRRFLAIGRKEALQRNRVDGQEYRPGLRQVEQDRLVAKDMPTGFQESQAGQKLGISFNEAIARSWVVPVSASRSKARISTPGQFVVLTLDNEFGVGKRIVIARVIDIEMGANNHSNVIGV